MPFRKILTFIALIIFSNQLVGQDYKFVNTEALNIREGAGKHYNVVGKISKGDKVTAISENRGWTQIETSNGIKGYVATKYLSLTDDTENQIKREKSPWAGLLIILGL